MSKDSQRWIAVLGRPDGPTDGVADYCAHLGEALRAHGYELETFRVPWLERGWSAALANLRREAEEWRGGWVLLQHTALGWSRRGFPIYAPRLLATFREAGARCAVVFHEFSGIGGSRIIDRARGYGQLRIVKRLYEYAERAIFTLPLEAIPWMAHRADKAVFIPIGANCPEPQTRRDESAGGSKTVAVYSVTGGMQTLPEVTDIVFAVRQAARAVGPLRLVVMGRGSKEAEPALREQLSGANVGIEALGLISAEQISRTLAAADVQLFVRNHISSRRGTAIAGIACGLPIVCYAGPETAWPVTEAGIVSAPLGNREALAAGLERVISDDTLRASLAARSRRAQDRYFSWTTIAAQYVAALGARAATSAGTVPAEAGVVERTK